MRAVPRTVTIGLIGVILACSSGCGIFNRDAVHSQWQNRPALPTCGEISLSPSDALEEAGAAGLQCLRKALDSGRGGELVVHYPSTEGDPITEYLRATPEGITEIYTDGTQDEYSDEGWSYGRCDAPGPALDFVC